MGNTLGQTGAKDTRIDHKVHNFYPELVSTMDFSLLEHRQVLGRACTKFKQKLFPGETLLAHVSIVKSQVVMYSH